MMTTERVRPAAATSSRPLIRGAIYISPDAEGLIVVRGSHSI